jgi:chorismate mutase
MPDLPLLCDPSHLAGDRRLVLTVAQEAMDFLFDGLMVEVHCSPTTALSDAKQQITPAHYGSMIRRLRYASANGKRLPQEIVLLRKEIDVIDRNIVGLLAKRMDFVRQIGTWKRDNNVSSFQPVRWRQVLARTMRESGQAHLSPSFVGDVFAHIHEEALRIQEALRREK